MAAGPPHYLLPPQTSRRHSSWRGRVTPWNLLKMAVFDSALGRPTPDYPLLQRKWSKKPLNWKHAHQKPTLKKAYSLLPRKHKASNFPLTTRVFVRTGFKRKRMQPPLSCKLESRAKSQDASNAWDTNVQRVKTVDRIQCTCSAGTQPWITYMCIVHTCNILMYWKLWKYCNFHSCVTTKNMYLEACTAHTTTS